MLSNNDILRILRALSEVNINNNFEDSFLTNIQRLEEIIDITSLKTLQSLKVICNNSSLNNNASFGRFVYLSLECLICLKENLKKQSDEAERLLSITQQRTVRTLFDKVIAVCLTPNLLWEVDPLLQNTSVGLPTSLSDIEKYEFLCLVTLVLTDLYHDDTFHSILLPQFLSPVLCALCQLTMVPLKKSADIFPQLQKDRLIFQQHLDELVTKLYQPMVIKELMRIEGNKKNPKWLQKGVGKLLTRQLHQRKGVLAVVEAVHDAANCAAPTTNAHLESLAQVITASPDLENICTQILDLLDSSNADLICFAVLCIKTLQMRDHLACESHLLQPITRPLTHTTHSEQELSRCLQRLHKCFAVPASDFWCLPSLLLGKYIHVLFTLYCRIYQSACHLRKTVEDLVWCYLSKCNKTELRTVFQCLVLGEKIPGIYINDDAEFIFGDDGGVKLIPLEESERSLEEYGDCLMILLERRDTDVILGNKLFMTLLEFATEKKEINTLDDFEQQFITVKLLSVLSENSAVQKSLSENPEPVVKFFKALIEQFLTDKNNELEVITIVLVVLNVILNECIYSKRNCWQTFALLKEPLSLLKSKTNNSELRLLAEEAHEIIMTHGAVEPSCNNNKQCAKESGMSDVKESKRKPSACEEALRDACDPLLPVRGHSMMQLSKLLAAGDKQARAKKDQILCILQENLKHDDSFLYLSAIEGLAVAASEFPDTVIMTLTEQYCRQSLKPDTRLKVGEALVRVTKLLGELVPVYKTELTNAFLSGIRDDDFLVRASSLSNLGELCRMLGFRIGPIVSEVLLCARCVVTSDPSIEARRAAVMLIYLLLKGLHTDALLVLQDVLLPLYQSLKRIYSSDKDDVMRLHAQLALEELNSGTLAFLFPTPKLTKQIFVLDPPP